MRKYKILKTLFSVLTVLVLLCTFALDIFASEPPVKYSASAGFHDVDIYTGNVDYLISFYSNSSDVTFASVVNPCFSYDSSLGAVNSNFSNTVTITDPGSGEPFNGNFYGGYSNFKCSDNFFTSSIPPVTSWFLSNFHFEFNGGNTVDFMTVEARDFYLYLDPGSELSDPNYDDLFCESFLYLNGSSDYSSGASGTICYVEAGVDDSPSNYKYYNYSLSSSETVGSEISNFSVLPFDHSFDGAYSEPTLIYVKSLSFKVPFGDPIFPYVSGVYGSYNLDYRNIDLSSSVAPEVPMNPSIFRDYTGWLGTAVGGFLDLQLVDGFTLGGILMVIIAFMITLWFLKVFAGG